tara:strand:+ start:186 stop:365 length:180 start_codon:yes stop_codon:yes gene_type:complete
MEKATQLMSNIDMIIDLEVHKELIELESEMFQANIDCLNALDELDEIREEIESSNDRDH